MTRPLSFLAAILFMTASTLLAHDIYIIQGFSYGAAAVWSTDAIFYNTGPADAAVTLLGISNSVDPAGRVGQSFNVPAGKAVSLQRETRWIPAIPLLVLHLDVPDNVTVSSILYIGSHAPLGISPSTLYRSYGTIRLPVIAALTPPNQPQVHLETDTGDIPAHINVGIYNASNDNATATIQTRAHCDNGAISTSTVTVSPNTVIQFGPFQADANRCLGPELPRSIYTVITVDQPSFTFVSALANDNAPTTSITITGN